LVSKDRKIFLPGCGVARLATVKGEKERKWRIGIQEILVPEV